MVTKPKGKLLPKSIRSAYEEWWNATGAADDKFLTFLKHFEDEGGSGEDLGDFVEAMYQLRSFGPNPLLFLRRV